MPHQMKFNNTGGPLFLLMELPIMVTIFLIIKSMLRLTRMLLANFDLGAILNEFTGIRGRYISLKKGRWGISFY